MKSSDEPPDAEAIYLHCPCMLGGCLVYRVRRHSEVVMKREVTRLSFYIGLLAFAIGAFGMGSCFALWIEGFK